MNSLKERPVSVSSSWSDVRNHAGTLALTYLSTVLLSTVGLIVFFILNFIFTAIGGGPYSDTGPILGVLLGSLGSFPIYVMVSLVGVLFMAIPAIYFESGEVISFGTAVGILRGNLIRFTLAGLFFVVVASFGFALCVLPGIAVFLTLPIYVNLIFNTNKSIFEAFSSSFSVVFRGHGWSFIGLQILVGIAIQFVSLCTCGVGAIVAVPLASFYLQNAAYNKGLIS